ncbi:MAG: MurR/RpiR family transcriptional regulator [Negativicutes bacterium]|jgi:DNA-binding MurR/RpiR family transcriptional regulator
MGRLMERFADKQKQLSESERYVFCHIDAALEKCSGYNLTQLAETAGVSTTTIIRMCHKIGCAGFSEFKYLLKQLCDKQLVYGDSAGQLCQALEQLFQEEKIGDYKLIADRIVAASRVYVFAHGLSKTVAEYFVQLLSQTGINAIGAYDSHMVDLLAANARHGEYCVFFSSSGNTRTLVTAAESLAARNIAFAAITANSNSRLVALAHSAPTVVLNKSTIHGYDVTPRSTMMVIVDLIFAEINREPER